MNIMPVLQWQFCNLYITLTAQRLNPLHLHIASLKLQVRMNLHANFSITQANKKRLLK